MYQEGGIEGRTGDYSPVMEIFKKESKEKDEY